MKLIDGDALKKTLRSNCKPELCHDYNTAWCDSCCRTNDFEDLIDNAPTVDNAYQEGHIDGMLQAEKIYARQQGEWIFASRHCYKCPFCNELSKGKNFCPNCGAELKGGAK